LRIPAAGAIARIDPGNAEAMAVLMADLDDGTELERSCAAKMLGEVGPAAKTAVPLLINVYKTGDFMSRGAAGQALKRIDPAEARRAGVK
jgi:HEAT repeat protein